MSIVGGVDVSNDVNAFRAAVDRLKTNDMNRAAAIALNRTTDRVQTAAIRFIRATHNVKRAELARAFTKRRAFAGKLEASLTASGRPLNLIGFDARQTKKGVTVNIKGSRKLLPGAFIATIKNNGYRGVFMRKGKARFPIKAITTVSVPGLFRRDIVSAAIAGVAIDGFRTELQSAIRAILLGR